MSDDENSVAVEAGGQFASVRWAVRFKVYGPAAASFAIWCVAWTYLNPPSAFFPLAIGGMLVGFFGGRATANELLQELRHEILRRDDEIVRISNSKAKLEGRLLAARGSSKDNHPRRRRS